MKLSEMADGIYYDISDEDYQSDDTRIRASQLKTYYDGSDYLLTIEKTFKEAGLGKALHYFMEHKHLNNVVNMELATGVKGYDTKKNLAYMAERPNSICLNTEDSEKVKELIRLLNTRTDTETQRINGFINNPEAKREVTVLFTIGDIKCKMRLDYLLIKDGKYSIKDYKTTSTKTMSAFERDYYSMGYFIQMYFYALGLQLVTGCGCEDIDLELFVFQTCEPYVFHTYQIHDDLENYDKVFNLIVSLVNSVDAIVNKGVFNGFIPKGGVKPKLSLSSWQMKAINERLKQIGV